MRSLLSLPMECLLRMVAPNGAGPRAERTGSHAYSVVAALLARGTGTPA